MQKYVDNLNKIKTNLEVEMETFNSKKHKLVVQRQKLRSKNYSLLLKKANINDEFYAKMTKHKLLQISNVLLSGASLYCLLIVNPLLGLSLGLLDAASIKKTSKLKKEIEKGNNVSVELLEHIISKNNEEIYKLNTLIEELNYVIGTKKTKINKINKEIKKVKNIGSSKRTYEEKAKVIQLKK